MKCAHAANQADPAPQAHTHRMLRFDWLIGGLDTLTARERASEREPERGGERDYLLTSFTCVFAKYTNWKAERENK